MIRVFCTLLCVVCLLLAGCAPGNQEPGARQAPRATATSLVRAVTPTATVARQCGQRRVSGKIVFAAEGVGGSFDLFVMNADGSGLRNLTRNPGPDRDPAWSPDGRQIAFYSRRDEGIGVFVTTSRQRAMNASRQASHPPSIRPGAAGQARYTV